MRCHYEVLGVERDADTGTIRKAYHRAALRWHPDKNAGQEEVATAEFRLVQQAYATLTDVNDRAWYDEHRDQILRGGDDALGDNGESGASPLPNVWPYFSPSCYTGYEDASGEGKDFFSVYGRVFADIWAAEDSEDDAAPPELGDMGTPWSQVKPFYTWWENYVTRMSFAWADKWDLRRAETRQIRRAMQKENRRVRNLEKRTWTRLVRQLARHVKSCDKRVMEAALRDRERKARKAKRQAELRAQRLAERTEARADALAQQEETLEQELDDDFLLQVLTAHGDTSFLQEEPELMERYRELQQEAEVDATDADADVNVTPNIVESVVDVQDEVDAEEEEPYCLACKRAFKTQGALRNHEGSRKHKQRVQRMREELLAEEMAARAAMEDAQRGKMDAQCDEPFLDDDDVSADDAMPEHVSTLQSMKKARKKRQKKQRQRLQQAQAAAQGRPPGFEDVDAEVEIEVAQPTKLTKRERRRRRQQQQQQQQQGGEHTRKVNGDAAVDEDKDRHNKAASSNRPGGDGRKKGKGRRSVSPAASQWVCKSCSKSFPSRNSLFKHLSATGHSKPL